MQWMDKHVAFWHALYRAHNHLRHKAADMDATPGRIRAELRGVLVKHQALRTAFPDTLPLV